MTTDIITDTAVFLYVHMPVVAIIIVTLIALNAIRKTMVARRRRNALARRAAKKIVPMNTFEIL